MDFRTFDDQSITEGLHLGLGFLESSLLYILNEGVPKTYFPSGKVLAMAVGCGHYSREASIIRAFHLLRFRIQPEDITAIGCDIDDLRPVKRIVGIDGKGDFVTQTYQRRSSDDDYDLILRGICGDASTDTPWLQGQNHHGEEDQKYDYTHIIYPYLSNLNSWCETIEKAFTHISDKGILSIISEGSEDISRLSRLQQMLIHTKKYQVGALQGFCYESTTPRSSYDYGLLCAHLESG